MLAGDEIDPVELFEMHEWVCHLCSEIIERHRRCPDKWAGTIDHVIPLSRGGTHTWDNVKPAHAICNFSKSDAVLTDTYAMV